MWTLTLVVHSRFGKFVVRYFQVRSMNQWLQLSRCRKSRTCCIWISTVNIIYYCIYVIHMPYIRSSAWPCNWLDHVLSMPQEWRWGTQCISRYHLKPSTKAKQSSSCLSKKNVTQSSVRFWCTKIPHFLDCINWKSMSIWPGPKFSMILCM